MQQLPTGWAVPDQLGKNLVIGPGAYIHPEILAREIALINEVTGRDVRDFLSIDYRCGLHMPYHTKRSSESGRHHSMGATGKGCSEAVMDKIRNRGFKNRPRLFTDYLAVEHKEIMRGSGPSDMTLLDGLNICDTAQFVNTAYDAGATVLVEGTQGTMLDLHLGPYPYTTHKQTQVGNWMAEAGLSPSLPVEVALVARTFPIRVAGNSGPLPNEIGWPELVSGINGRLTELGLPPRVAHESIRLFEEACELEAHKFWTKGKSPAGGRDDFDWKIEEWSQAMRADTPRNTEFVSELHKLALDSLPRVVVEDLCRVFEMTTVTNKLRRVARLDMDSLRYSVMLNRPAYVVMTFINYLFPETWDLGWDEMPKASATEIEAWTEAAGRELGTEIRYVSTGAKTEHVLEIGA